MPLSKHTSPTPDNPSTVPPAAETSTISLQGEFLTPLDGGGPQSQHPTAVAEKVIPFGDYEILGEIARGGMGVVFRARQKKLKRIVALKLLLSGEYADDTAIKRFRAEAEAAATLEHPRIVPIFEVGEHEGRQFFSMGFIEGQSLSKRVIDGPLPPREAADLMQKIAEAVEYAHSKGIVHRDLKPSNILLDAAGEPRVTDFGLAKRVACNSELTSTGQFLGTPAYASPEQASFRNEDVGTLSDVYSLGATLYCLITGRPPFMAATPQETVKLVVDSDPVSPTRLNPSVPPDLETICLKCMAKDPRHRFSSAAELAADLERFLQGKPILARPVNLFERAWKWYSRHAHQIAAAYCVYSGLSPLLSLFLGALVGSTLNGLSDLTALLTVLVGGGAYVGATIFVAGQIVAGRLWALWLSVGLYTLAFFVSLALSNEMGRAPTDLMSMYMVGLLLSAAAVGIRKREPQDLDAPGRNNWAKLPYQNYFVLSLLAGYFVAIGTGLIPKITTNWGSSVGGKGKGLFLTTKWIQEHLNSNASLLFGLTLFALCVFMIWMDLKKQRDSPTNQT
jgi:tRNA A-37 threonylcarbamoyl transferase component Bud32